MALLEVSAARKAFDGVEVLKGVDLTVDRGDVVCVLGRSGSGKTTLLRCINHLEKLDSGLILINGEPVGYRKDSNGKVVEDRDSVVARRRAEIGMVFQRFNLFAHLTAIENVIEAPIHVKREARDQVMERAKELLGWAGLSQHESHYPHQLSGGQQQRVAIVRALAMRPKLMLFDEATSALDPELVGEVLDTMRRIAAEGTTMVVVTHEIGFAREVADRVVVMDDGAIVESGAPREVLDTPSDARTRAFLARML